MLKIYEFFFKKISTYEKKRYAIKLNRFQKKLLNS